MKRGGPVDADIIGLDFLHSLVQKPSILANIWRRFNAKSELENFQELNYPKKSFFVHFSRQ